ncbi:nuclear GTPase SLIP-GC isoform X2 [Lepisosteus oculatus]|uniref:nuclear GTPase SLIP-GC isoform X2 n=1 Tax=Lepisosteus oculatus TaxID=7918 RepID=UPI0035F502AB
MSKPVPSAHVGAVAFAVPQNQSDLPPGVYSCNARRCNCCNYLHKGIDTFRSKTRNKDYPIKDILNCKTYNVIYVIQCKKCDIQYVGKTISSLHIRFRGHKSNITNKYKQPIAEHFNSKDHSLEDLSIFPIEQVIDQKTLGERETHWINELGTLLPDGLNLGTYDEVRKRKREDGPDTPTKKKKKRHPVFSYEIEDRLNTCNDTEEEARKIISELSEALENVRSNEEGMNFLDTLKKRISALKNGKATDKIYIGVFGKTGVGKSSLINAILDERQLLPSASGHACTSVFVHVQTNENSSEYKAEIEFISKEDWEIELPYLLEIISEKTNDGDDMQQIAEEKIKAVYGADALQKSIGQLMGSKNIPEIPDSPKKVVSFNASRLGKEISCYIRSDHKGQTQYWPFVKRVTIYVPHSSALLERIVLVDLPGAGDANKIRDEMWKMYLSKCSSVWIVNEINRAQSEKTATEILENSLRDIAGGGQCHNITFICTKTDDINPDEFKSNYELSDEELGLTDIQDPLIKEKKEKEACILRRNKRIKRELQQLLHSKAKRFLFGESGEKDNVFDIYTVSSIEFWKNKQGRSTILDLNDTEIPLLQEHIKELYVTHCEKAVRDYVSDVSGIVSYLHLAKEKCSRKNEDDKLFKILSKNLEKMCDSLKKFLNTSYSELGKYLQEGAQLAEKNCVKTANNEVLEPHRDPRGYHKTLKALCRNAGSFRSASGNIVDLNYTLSKPMYEKVNHIFISTFRFDRGTRKSIKGNLDSFQCDFVSSEWLKHHKNSPTYLRLVCIKTELRHLLSDLEKIILNKKKNIYNSLSDSVKNAMLSAYQEGACITGTFTLSKIKAALETQIESLKTCMFQEAKTEMLRQFNDMKEIIVNRLQNEMSTSLTLYLRQIPGDISFPDVAEEFERMKESCKALNLQIFT